MEPGKKYRGYGWINTKREFFFHAHQTGTGKRIENVVDEQTFSIQKTSQHILCKIKIPLSIPPANRVEYLLTAMNKCLKEIMKNEI